MMPRRLFACVLVLATALSARPAGAEKVLARWDFETADPLEFGAGSKEYVLNSKGLTEEMPHSGQKCLKVDTSFPKGGSHCYWRVPIPPISMRSHRLMLRGWMRVTQHDTRSINFGYTLPGWNCEPFHSSVQMPGEWVEQSCNLRTRLLRFDDEPLLTLDGWYLSFVGLAGRNVVYLDDVELVEDHPDPETDAKVDADIRTRRSLMDAFRGKLARVQGDLIRAARKAPPSGKQQDAASVCERALLQAVGERIEAMSKRMAAAADPASRVLLADLRDELAALDCGVRALSALRACGPGRAVVVFSLPAISNILPNPRDLPLPGLPTRKVEVSVCAGQYEPACLALWAPRDVHALSVMITPLRSGAAALPAEAVGLRVVKSWYQARDPLKPRRMLLTPELLLRNDALVTVDDGAMRNAIPPIGEMRDAPALQPFTLSAGSARLLWVTLHVPDGTAPGRYAGKLVVSDGEQATTEIPLAVHVLPFSLKDSGMTWGMFYRGVMDAQQPSVASDHKTEAQYEADMRTLHSHGMIRPTFYSTHKPQTLLAEMRVRNRVGLPKDAALLTGGQRSGADIGPARGETRVATVEGFRRYVRGLVDLARKADYRTVSVFGTDEAPEEVVQGELDGIAAAREEGAVAHRTYWSKDAIGPKRIDLAIIGFDTPRERIDEIRRSGSRAVAYSAPYGWSKEPYTFRLHYGLALWRRGFDGGVNYAYQHAGDLWDAAASFNAMALCYPTADGVVETVQWEGVRAGVDDCRYLATLRAAIAAASKNPRRKRLAEQAAAWLEKGLGAAVDASLSPTVCVERGRRALWVHPEYLDLDSYRRQMAEWILRLE